MKVLEHSAFKFGHIQSFGRNGDIPVLRRGAPGCRSFSTRRRRMWPLPFSRGLWVWQRPVRWG